MRQMLYQLQNFSRHNFNNQLEFRPWPKTYKIKHPKYEYAEASFIGIRFRLKADAEAPLKSDVQDLKKYFENFYDKLRGNAAKNVKPMMSVDQEELMQQE